VVSGMKQRKGRQPETGNHYLLSQCLVISAKDKLGPMCTRH